MMLMLHLLCSHAVMSLWRYLVPTGTSDGHGQELVSWSFWVCGSQGAAGELWQGACGGPVSGELEGNWSVKEDPWLGHPTCV